MLQVKKPVTTSKHHYKMIFPPLFYEKIWRRSLLLYLILVGFGRACAPVRCAHPSFWAHAVPNGVLRAPPPPTHRSFAAFYSYPKN
jgi:hypothetical protein